MADPWTEAWEEAEATAPPGVLIYATIELIHPAFVDESDVAFSIRAVAGTGSAFNATLEDDAPLNAGEEVTFSAIPFTSERPEFVDGQPPTSEITLDNVAREVMPYLEAAVRQRADLQLIYREFRSDDTSAPCYGPVSFVIKQVTVTRTRISGKAQIDDLANRKFPRHFYTLREFPGLQQS